MVEQFLCFFPSFRFLSKDIKKLLLYFLASYFIDKPPSIDFPFVKKKKYHYKDAESSGAFVLYEFLVEHSKHEFMLMHGLFTLHTCSICVKSCECVPLSWQRYNIYMTIQNECV